MIYIKTDEQIATMREAGRIVAQCHALIAERMKPGITTLSLDQLVEQHIVACGAKPSFKGHHGFPASICVARNDVICHGFPSNEPLEDGDVVTIDIGAYYKGFHGDSGWTYAVGNISHEAHKLMKDCHHALYLGIEQAVDGNHVGDIGHAIDTFAQQEGYGNVKQFTGHAVGASLWEDPAVPHYGTPGTGTQLRNGLVLAIEPMFTLGTWRATVDKDGWTARTADGSLCVQYEHSVALTPNGPLILTEL